MQSVVAFTMSFLFSVPSLISGFYEAIPWGEKDYLDTFQKPH